MSTITTKKITFRRVMGTAFTYHPDSGFFRNEQGVVVGTILIDDDGECEFYELEEEDKKMAERMGLGIGTDDSIEYTEEPKVEESVPSEIYLTRDFLLKYYHQNEIAKIREHILKSDEESKTALATARKLEVEYRQVCSAERVENSAIIQQVVGRLVGIANDSAEYEYEYEEESDGDLPSLTPNDGEDEIEGGEEVN